MGRENGLRQGGGRESGRGKLDGCYQTKHDEALLKAHRLLAGVFRRVGDKLGVDASYVSQVAMDKRKIWKIHRALLDELRRYNVYQADQSQPAFRSSRLAAVGALVASLSAGPHGKGCEQ